MFRFSFVIALLVLCVGAVSAQTITQIGGGEGDLLASGSKTFTAAALEGADQYTDLIPTIVGGKRARLLVCALVATGLSGGTAAGTATHIDVRAYGCWAADDTYTSGLYRTTMGVGRGDTITSDVQQVAIAANAAFSFPFFVQALDLENSGFTAPVFPYISIRVDKEGDGEYTAGSFTLYWQVYK